MDTPIVPILCYWGGSWDKHTKTYSCENPKACFMASCEMSYDELIAKVYSVGEFDPSTWRLKLSGACPIMEGGETALISIENNNTTQFMLSLPRAIRAMASVQLYIEMEKINFDEEDRVHGSFTQLLSFSPTVGVASTSSQERQLNVEERHHDFECYRSSSIQEDYMGPIHSGHVGASNANNTSNEGDIPFSRLSPLHDSNHADENNDIENEGDNISSEQEILRENNDENVDKDDEEFNLGDDTPCSPHEPYSRRHRVLDDIEDRPTKRQKNVEFNASVDDLTKGMLFTSKEVMMDAVNSWHIKNNKVYEVYESKRDVVLLTCKVAEQQGCQWRLRAPLSRKTGYWTISKLPYPHTCVSANLSADHKHITARMIASHVRNLVNEDPGCKVKLLVEKIQKDFHYTVTYKKAWHGKQIAIASLFGNWEESYNRLPRLLAAIMHYNPGSPAELIFVDKIKTLTHPPGYEELDKVFWTFMPCIKGWRCSRPVLAIDSIYLTGKYRGMLLIAMGYDSNQQMYPLAYGVVESGSVECYGWFLSMVRKHVVGNRDDVCLITRHDAALCKEFDDQIHGWHHRVCLSHLDNRFAKAHKGDNLKLLFKLASKTHQVRKFEGYMEAIKKISRDAHDYLRAIPAQKWSLAHDGGRRFGQLTSNTAECYNLHLRGVHHLPIAVMVQMTFDNTLNMFHKKRMDATQRLARGKQYTESALKWLDHIQTRARVHEVIPLDLATSSFQVKTPHRRNAHGASKGGNVYNVHLLKKHCSCGKYTSYGFCSHAYACCQKHKLDKFDFVSEHCKVQQYLNMWNPVLKPLACEDCWTFPLPEAWDGCHKKLLPNPKLKRKTFEIQKYQNLD